METGYKNKADAAALQRIEVNVAYRIEETRASRERTRFASGIILSVGALVSALPVLRALISAMRQSGFSLYISLISSDGASVLSHAQIWLLSLADSIPIIEVTVALGLLFIFATGIKNIYVSQTTHTIPNLH